MFSASCGHLDDVLALSPLLSGPLRRAQSTLAEARLFWFVLPEHYGVLILRVMFSGRGEHFTVLTRSNVLSHGIVAATNGVTMNRKAGTWLLFFALHV